MLYKEALIGSVLKAGGNLLGKGIITAGKVPYKTGKLIGTQVVKHPKAALGAATTGLLAKENISTNLKAINPSYTKQTNVLI